MLLSFDDIKEKLINWELYTPDVLEIAFQQFYEDYIENIKQLESRKKSIEQDLQHADKKTYASLSSTLKEVGAEIQEAREQLNEVIALATSTKSDAKTKARYSYESYRAIKNAYKKVHEMTIISSQTRRDDEWRLEEAKRETDIQKLVADTIEKFLDKIKDLNEQEKGEE